MVEAARDDVLADTGRTEAFSDGVLAIAITLLVLDLAVPLYRSGHLAESLRAQWPAYLAFLASFLFIAVIWLNHHAAFRRVHSVDRVLSWANLGLLLFTVLLPFPTSVLAEAFQRGDRADERTAVALYAVVCVGLAAAWFLFFTVLARRDHLSIDQADEAWWAPPSRARAVPGVFLYAVAGVAGLLIVPALALALFIALPIFYAVTAEGFAPGRSGPTT